MKHPRLYFVFVFSHSIQCFWMLIAKDILECVELGFLRKICFVVSNISFYSWKEWSERILASESGYHGILLFFPPNVSNLLLHLSAFYSGPFPPWHWESLGTSRNIAKGTSDPRVECFRWKSCWKLNKSNLIFDQTITNCCPTVKNRCYVDVKLSSVLILLSMSPTSTIAIISTSFVLESSTARVTPIKSQQQDSVIRTFSYWQGQVMIRLSLIGS